ncbi:DUF2497 domain-containing protein [Limobrevibacterium gyesilva]|uniref:DUF2497 domain-containing protein n=1 Tax=Limobrevibacterium gyesilva TaxID=2991712 RepID=A0AA41YKY2_9PROT|nr:DUF2497 domain-containing protein [Limobrevibacterium gyesilva]MCW3475754.1 DUF2497 domain-containing protein [Limobrevibacterium gyesilva]
MSASHPPQSGGPAASPAAGAADPSMEDILASIRRILSEDDPAAPLAGGQTPAPQDGSHRPVAGDVLALDASMIVGDERPTIAGPPPAAATSAAETPADPAPAPSAAPTPAALVAPEAAAAAAASVGALLRTLIAEREQIAVHRGGPTIEDLVREEIRPLLKQWLDTNLPVLVERLVRTEIERVVGRAVS